MIQILLCRVKFEKSLNTPGNLLNISYRYPATLSFSSIPRKSRRPNKLPRPSPLTKYLSNVSNEPILFPSCIFR